MAGQTPETEIIEGPSRRAREQAERRNRRILLAALGRAKAPALQSFITANISALPDSAGTLFAAAQSKDKKEASAALRKMREIAKNHARRARDLPSLDTSAIRVHKTVTPEQIQKQIDARTAHTAAAWTSLGQAGKSLLRGVASVLPYYAFTKPPTVSLPRFANALANISVVPLTHLWVAGAHAAGWGPTRRVATLSAAAATAIGAVTFVPIDPTPYTDLFLPKQLSQNIFHAACKDPRVLHGDRLTAAFAVSHYGNTDANKALADHAAMQSLATGMSPIPARIVAGQETAEGNDAVAKYSSATGPYQSLNSTKMDLLANYAKKTDYYKQAKARAGESERDRTFVLAIDKTIADYKANPQGFLARVQDKRISLATLLALNESASSEFAGQLQAEQTRDYAPNLSAKKLAGKSSTKIIDETASYYHSHMLGKEGGAFYDYVLAKAPQTMLDDTKALQKLYKQHRPDAKPDMVAYMGNYFIKVGPLNPAAIGNPHKTAAEVADKFRTFTAQWAKPVLAKVEKAMERGSNAFEICLNDPTTAHAQGIHMPETTTVMEVTYLQARSTLRDTLPDAVMHTSASFSKLAQDWWNAAFTDAKPETPKPAPATLPPAKPTSIGDLIGQSAQAQPETIIIPRPRPIAPKS